jgi:hypothetical protein
LNLGLPNGTPALCLLQALYTLCNVFVADDSAATSASVATAADITVVIVCGNGCNVKVGISISKK